MRPILDSYAASGLGGTGGDITWSHEILGNLGKNGAMFIAGMGAETGGEQNPEEINVCYIVVSGTPRYFTRIADANNSETGSGLYVLQGSSVPPPGIYTCGINFKDSPKQAERKRGVSAAFRNVLNQSAEASGSDAGTNSPRAVNLTPISKNALVVASWGWRVGFAETWGWGTPIVTSRGDNSGGITLAYSVVTTPALQSISCGATNPESNGMVAAAFKPSKDQGGGFIQ